MKFVCKREESGPQGVLMRRTAGQGGDELWVLRRYESSVHWVNWTTHHHQHHQLTTMTSLIWLLDKNHRWCKQAKLAERTRIYTKSATICLCHLHVDLSQWRVLCGSLGRAASSRRRSRRRWKRISASCMFLLTGQLTMPLDITMIHACRARCPIPLHSEWNGRGGMNAPTTPICHCCTLVCRSYLCCGGKKPVNWLHLCCEFLLIYCPPSGNTFIMQM